MNCSAIGRSNPISARIAATSAWLALGGSDMPSGSAGNNLKTVKTSAATINMIGKAVRMRRASRARAVAVMDDGRTEIPSPLAGEEGGPCAAWGG